jgi:mRNA interferase RelE/StbE
VEKYKALIAASAAKELEAVEGKALRLRLIDAISALTANPRRPGAEKLSGSHDRYRIRLGDYRIVYSIDDSRHLVDVVKIGHRREIYRR